MQKFFKSWHFFVLIAIAILAIAIMIHAAASGNTDVFLSQAASVVSQPFLDLNSTITNSIDDFLDRFVRTEKVYLKNDELNERVRELEDKLVDYEKIKRENDQLRKFLELKETNPDYEFEPATVIGRDASSRFASFTIDKGSIDGIKTSDPIITSDGLIGIVWEVGTTYSHVRTILDISVEVGVYSISTRDSGIISGDISLASDGLCRLSYLPKNSGIASGDIVVTSGIGGVYPKDLRVGTVKNIKLDGNGLSLSAEIVPFADISNVTDVIVLKSFNGQSERFEEDGDAE